MTLDERIDDFHLPLKGLFKWARELLEVGDGLSNPEYIFGVIDLLDTATGGPKDLREEIAGKLGVDYDKLLEARAVEVARRTYAQMTDSISSSGARAMTDEEKVKGEALYQEMVRVSKELCEWSDGLDKGGVVGRAWGVTRATEKALNELDWLLHPED